MNLPQITNDTRPGGLMWQVQTMVARINLVWAREHHADGRHILPKWYDVPFSPSTFTSAGGFTVGTVYTYTYWKHGDCLCVALTFAGTLTVGTDTSLKVRLPEGFVSLGHYLAVADVVQGAAYTTGNLAAQPQSTTLSIERTNRAAFTAGAIQVSGQLMLRTTV